MSAASAPTDTDRPSASRARPVLQHLASWAAPLAACAWLAVVLALRWPVWTHPSFTSDSTLDSAFFGYAGELVRGGGVPYLTFWDHKAPLIFLINAAGLALGGGAVWGLWLVNLGLLAAATWLGHAAMRRAFGARAALLGTVCFAFPVAAMLPANLTEGYVLPLQWAAVLLLATDRTVDRPWRLGLGIGALGALAFFLRANLAGAAFCVALVVVVATGRQGAWRRAARFVAGGVLGAGAVTAALLGWLAGKGALGAFWDQAFHYNFLYAGSELRTKAGAFQFGVAQVTRYASAIVPFAAWGLCLRQLWLRRRERQPDAVLLLAVVWLPLELALASTSGRQYGHYFATAFAPLAWLAAAFVAQLRAVAPAAFERGPTVPLLAAGTAVFAMMGTGFDITTDRKDAERRAQITATADYVRRNTAPGAALLVWGHAADLHFFSGRPPASRFVYPLPLLTPRYADAALVAQYIEQVRASAPPVIVDASPNAKEGEDMVPPLDTWNPAWFYPKDARPGRRWWAMTPALHPFYDYVHAHYAPVGTVGPKQWVIYRRIEGRDAS
ncbi:MAG TPA: hypothetical protein VFE82_11005 [Ramlibacter sp.]|jgi:hypothetical protein|uniref:ArnT family glycosyltransferase n=1 Tax=Ramlibacter sp. TaxID=1917967 RepID=UPI002D2584B5|nr:hypothetical protein [Ramlibacter sp.]HZY19001.1 hypothetical protein [Ramlibacter sp.]